MNIIFILGRILFVVVFILSGVRKLMDISGTAAFIGSKVMVPEMFVSSVSQLESATGMTLPTMLAILTAVVEIGASLLVAANFGARFGSVLLILFTAAATYYVHPFWTMADAEREANMINALKNLSLIGGLLVFFVLGPWRPLPADSYDEPSPRI
jgi:uncharacterized membrane protein YphA (DoxX/SURF4 family)